MPAGHCRQATSQRGGNRPTIKATFRLHLGSMKPLLRTTVDKQGVKETKPGDLYCCFTAALLLTEMGEQSSPHQRSLIRLCCLIRIRMLPHTCVCTNKETETGEQSSPCQRRQMLLAPLLVCEKKRKKEGGKHQIFSPQAFALLLMCYSSSSLLYCFTALLLLYCCVLTDVLLE